MRSVVALFAAVLLITLSVTVFAAEQQKPPTASAESQVPAIGCLAVQPCSIQNNMMMPCPMMKQAHELKEIVKDLIGLLQRMLTASADEKKKIGEELTVLAAKLDTMTAEMICPMMNTHQQIAPEGSAMAPAKNDSQKPRDHKH